jgi:hypothetical protein
LLEKTITENQETNHDATSAESLPEIMTEYEKKYVEFLGRRQEILPLNKTAIFRVLTAAGIESIEAYNGNDPVALPDQTIDYQKAAWGKSEIEQTSFAIRDAIETMAYEFLSQTHCGWENNDGAYGEFTCDVSEQTITLDYNERYTSSENYTHEF